jgi:hypothetical protein
MKIHAEIYVFSHVHMQEKEANNNWVSIYVLQAHVCT